MNGHPQRYGQDRSGIFFALYVVMGHGLETTRARAVTHLNGIFSREFAGKHSSS